MEIVDQLLRLYCRLQRPQTQPQHLVLKYEVGVWRNKREVKYVCFVDDDTFPQKKFSLTVPPLVQGTTILDSPHGLLCMLNFLRQPDDYSKTQMAVLWNPAIRKSIVVDVPNVFNFPFDSAIGFGVCPNTKDPKLVKITYIHDGRDIKSISCIPCQVMVFTLSSGEWRTSRSNQLPRKSIEFGSGCQTVIGQFIYFHAYDWTNNQIERHNQIMSFDLITDEFREVDIPERLLGACISISRLRDSLVLLEYEISFETQKQVCRVWMMEHGDRKAFTKLFTIKPPHASVVWTLGFRKSGEPIIEMENDIEEEFTSAVVYEPGLKNIKDLGICGPRRSFFLNSNMESLLLLDHDDGDIVGC